jgi:antitoxin (DNA-binding transcriptional repressor) of toxin-antitoxin stability system
MRPYNEARGIDEDEGKNAMQTATIEEVQTELPRLLRELETNGEIVIVSNGQPVARLVPPVLPKGVPIPGRGKGKLVINVEDDEHLKDFAEYMP